MDEIDYKGIARKMRELNPPPRADDHLLTYQTSYVLYAFIEALEAIGEDNEQE